MLGPGPAHPAQLTLTVLGTAATLRYLPPIDVAARSVQVGAGGGAITVTGHSAVLDLVRTCACREAEGAPHSLVQDAAENRKGGKRHNVALHDEDARRLAAVALQRDGDRRAQAGGPVLPWAEGTCHCCSTKSCAPSELPRPKLWLRSGAAGRYC